MRIQILILRFKGLNLKSVKAGLCWSCSSAGVLKVRTKYGQRQHTDFKEGKQRKLKVLNVTFLLFFTFCTTYVSLNNFC